MNELNLEIKGLSLGTHQVSWDLKVLLYKGAANIRRTNVIKLIDSGEMGMPEECRLTFVLKLHDLFTTYVSRGSSQATVHSYLERIWLFYSWSDNNNFSIDEESVIDIFRSWTEQLIFRVNVLKNIKQMTAYKTASMVASIIAKSLNLAGNKPGHNLMLTTRLRRPKTITNGLNTKLDRQNLADTFDFGRTLTRICESLDIQTVRGSVPIKISLDEDQLIILAGNLINPDVDTSKIENKHIKKIMEATREPLPDGKSLFDTSKRSSIINLRIECELLLFLGQTGMNTAQAANLTKSKYRWKSVGEDYDVYQVYKHRREGEAHFRCYKLYREHFEKYLKWLDETCLSDNSNKLFPLYSRSIVKAENSKVKFIRCKKVFKELSKNFINPSQLRKTRVNWLLRYTDNLELTAEHMGHTPSVLLRNYKQPHHQKAVNEIVKFHNLTDLNCHLAPGPGVCTDAHQPSLVSNIAKDIPTPDCVSSEGCLFCIKHRDVMSYDYCWKLTSHLKIKTLEVNLYKPPINQQIHPANLVIERIREKLEAIAQGSELRSMWVKEAYDSTRSGKFHPTWEIYIKLMESMA